MCKLDLRELDKEAVWSGELEPFINDLEAAEMAIDFAYRWHGFPPDWYEGAGPNLLDQAWEVAKYGSPED